MIGQAVHDVPTDVSAGWGPDEEMREHFRGLLQRLPWPGGADAPALALLGVTSCRGGEGVSTIAAQLAATAAASAQPVLLVDANLARPSVHATFALPPAPGLAEALLERARPGDLAQRTAVPGLSILAAGAAAGRLARACEAASLADVVDSLREGFGLVVFDLPALGAASFAARLAGLLDGVVLVVEAERTRREVVLREKETLARVNARLLGAILNRRRQHIPAWLYRML